MDRSSEPPRTTQLLAERWATHVCAIQRRISQGDALKFAGAAIAAGAWFTFVILAKGTMDFQATDLVAPVILTVIALAVAGLGFSRERRARKELRDATTKLALDLHTRPPVAPEEGDPPPSPWP